MSYKDEYVDIIEGQFFDLENRIMADIVRRIKKTGDITSTADYQIERLYDMFGFSSEEIEASIKEALNASYPEMFELYDRVIDEEYTRNKAIYEQINGTFVPYEQNGQLQQWIEAAKRQTEEELKNITATMGFVSNINGQMTFLPLTDFYKKTMDAAIMDITSGAFDYNSTLKRTVREMTNSGVRWIEYESGWHNRITVSARRAVMTGVSQLTGKISEMNAEKLGTEYFEIDWHAGARPSHAEWQGKVWSKEELVTVCGLGTVTGLNGANCYHTYYPFILGISERNYTDEWLEEQNKLESIPKSFKGKDYTLYEASQKQRYMETAMRAQRERIRHLEDGGVDPDELILQKCRYQGQLQEYASFCKEVGLKPQRDRIYIDGLGNVVYSKRKSRVNMLAGGKTAKISEKTGKGLGAKIGGKELIPLHEEPALLKKIDYSSKKAVKNELKSFEKNAITEEVETACVVTTNGEVYKCFGIEDRVFPDYDLKEKLKGASVSHNHPIDETVFSFSKDDLQLFIEYDLDVLRGCDEKYTYEFNRNPAEIDEPMEDWMNFENYNHVNIIRLAKEYGIGYRRWKNE